MTAAIPDETLTLLKDRARASWSSGDYDAVAEGIWEVGERIVRRVAVAEGERVLDVACGTGNAAIRAAQAGGRVIGLDLTPELFPAARRRAEEAGVEIEWVEGDAEALPYGEGTFDVVLSTFGVMFAPRHAVAARELARVVRPGGRIGLATWTPDGTVSEVFRAVAGALPPPPAIAEAPLSWGSPEHVERLFAGTGVALTFAREELAMDPDIDPTQAAEFYVASFGPIIKAREALEPEGRWEPLAQRLAPILERMVREPATYVAISGVKRPD